MDSLNIMCSHKNVIHNKFKFIAGSKKILTNLVIRNILYYFFLNLNFISFYFKKT